MSFAGGEGEWHGGKETPQSGVQSRVWASGM